MLSCPELIARLQGCARDVLDALIPARSKVVLLDYPNYSNVGDSLIWLGEIAYLRSRGLGPDYVCDLKSYDRRRLAEVIRPDTIILLEGGGNFGTLWPAIHEFRLRVLEAFPQVRTIQLPQSIHFAREQDAAGTARLIGAHRDFTLLVRDRASLDFARRHFDCTVHLCPDMAFFVGPVQRKAGAVVDSLVLARTDIEKLPALTMFPAPSQASWTLETTDWLDQGRLERFLGRLARRTKRLRPTLDPYNRGLLPIWNLLARARLVRGARLLGRGRTVITDRLHGHVLSLLLGIPHVILDNSYGKVDGFHDAWTKTCATVRSAGSLGDAILLAQELLEATANGTVP